MPGMLQYRQFYDNVFGFVLGTELETLDATLSYLTTDHIDRYTRFSLT